jgi:hypothetical protein
LRSLVQAAPSGNFGQFGGAGAWRATAATGEEEPEVWLQPPRAIAARKTPVEMDALHIDSNLDFFRIANSAKRAMLEFRRLPSCTHVARDNQPHWIAAGSVAYSSTPGSSRIRVPITEANGTRYATVPGLVQLPAADLGKQLNPPFFPNQ